jgi:hypothetical protein
VISDHYTNAFFARAFEGQVRERIPGLVQLRALPKLSAIPGSGIPVRTNGVLLRIVAAGPTAPDAQRAANEAATRLCQTVLANYGATGEVCEQARSARRYSIFNDSFRPAIERLFGH